MIEAVHFGHGIKKSNLIMPPYTARTTCFLLETSDLVFYAASQQKPKPKRTLRPHVERFDGTVI